MSPVIVEIFLSGPKQKVGLKFGTYIHQNHSEIKFYIHDGEKLQRQKFITRSRQSLNMVHQKKHREVRQIHKSNMFIIFVHMFVL